MGVKEDVRRAGVTNDDARHRLRWIEMADEPP